MNSKKMMYEQLAADLCCTIVDLKNDKNIFICDKKLEGARTCKWDAISKLKLICINNKIVARSEDSKVIDWLKENYTDFKGEWLSEYYSLRKLDEGLKQFGICIGDFHPFFIPEEKKFEPNYNVLKSFELKWYNEQEILQFKGDQRFKEALVFDEIAPDMIAITAEDNGQIIAMVAANTESKTIWQIGINVMPDYKGHGIGTAMVTLLKNKIMEMNILPYYGTAMSHTNSQLVAIKSGFLPAWAELGTMSIDE